MIGSEVSEELYTKTNELNLDYEVFIQELDGTLLPVKQLTVDTHRGMIILSP